MKLPLTDMGKTVGGAGLEGEIRSSGQVKFEIPTRHPVAMRSGSSGEASGKR